ncbi:MAG TPA: UDP-3-O-acyl-N-acetylglucosamine deacetylase [Candidatus Obscuribacterales bacterium]
MTIQHALASAFELSGVGLHTGVVTQVRVKPAISGEGRYFVRVDLPDSPVIPARIESVSQTTLSTELAAGDAHVRTVEHLLAALAGMGVDDARIEIDGPELPLLDGSARLWAEAIRSQLTMISPEDPIASTITKVNPVAASAPSQRHHVVLQQPIWVHKGDAFVAAIPSPTTVFTYGIDFDTPAIGKQWHTWTPQTESFEEAIAPARTFTLAEQIDFLRNAGLIKGGSLDNALVCDANGWLNPPLRFSNEPVRHKLLDLVGDLSLLGAFPQAHFLAYKASHNLHIQLAQELARNFGF